jgi:hypothetical protein
MALLPVRPNEKQQQVKKNLAGNTPEERAEITDNTQVLLSKI